MMMVPPMPVAWALMLCAAFPFLLLLLSHGPAKITAPGRRFVVVWSMMVLIWAALCAARASVADVSADYASGLMIFGAAILISFMFWSVLCWGVTLNMLVYMGPFTRPVSRPDWERGYAGPGGLSTLVSNRAELLINLGLATQDAERSAIGLTVAGRLTARLAVMLAAIFSVDL